MLENKKRMVLIGERFDLQSYFYSFGNLIKDLVSQVLGGEAVGEPEEQEVVVRERKS
jgi:hypothetical protein